VRGQLQTCSYCGDYADTVDHCPPVLLKNEVPDSERFCVASCKHCNSMLGAKRLFTLLDRQMWVQLRLREKYKNELSVKVWSKEELAELGSGLRGRIKRAQAKTEKIRRRLSFDYNTLVEIMPYFETGRSSKPVGLESDGGFRLNYGAIRCLPEGIGSHV
jgi:hypothetical protein